MKTMEDFLKWLWGGVITYGLLIITIIVTFVMALMRTKRNQGKVDWIEACITNNFIILRGEVCKRI